MALWRIAPVVASGALLALFSASALADGPRSFRTDLLGYEEVPALSTPGSGEFRARLDRDETELTYELSYSDLENVQQAHIHFGQKGVNGGIAAFLCSNLQGAPAGTPPCPPAPATVTGTVTADDVVGPAGQGIAPQEFGELLQAIRAGVTYVNVHTDGFPDGEIRGQLDRGRGPRPGGDH